LPVTPDQISATVHVDDLAFAYLAIIERRDDPAVRGQIFNIINPVGEKRKDILAAVSSITGFKGEYLSVCPCGVVDDCFGFFPSGTIAYRAPATPIEVFSAYTSDFDTTKPRAVLGWVPKHPGFVDGIQRWGRAYQAYL